MEEMLGRKFRQKLSALGMKRAFVGEPELYSGAALVEAGFAGSFEHVAASEKDNERKKGRKSRSDNNHRQGLRITSDPVLDKTRERLAKQGLSSFDGNKES